MATMAKLARAGMAMAASAFDGILTATGLVRAIAGRRDLGVEIRAGATPHLDVARDVVVLPGALTREMTDKERRDFRAFVVHEAGSEAKRNRWARALIAKYGMDIGGGDLWQLCNGLGDAIMDIETVAEWPGYGADLFAFVAEDAARVMRDGDLAGLDVHNGAHRVHLFALLFKWRGYGIATREEMRAAVPAALPWLDDPIIAAALDAPATDQMAMIRQMESVLPALRRHPNAGGQSPADADPGESGESGADGDGDGDGGAGESASQASGAPSGNGGGESASESGESGEAGSGSGSGDESGESASESGESAGAGSGSGSDESASESGGQSGQSASESAGAGSDGGESESGGERGGQSGQSGQSGADGDPGEAGQSDGGESGARGGGVSHMADDPALADPTGSRAESAPGHESPEAAPDLDPMSRLADQIGDLFGGGGALDGGAMEAAAATKDVGRQSGDPAPLSSEERRLSESVRRHLRSVIRGTTYDRVPNQKRGRVNRRALARAGAGLDRRPFEKRRETPGDSAALAMCIDESSSLTPDQVDAIRSVAVAWGVAADSLGMPFTVNGFGGWSDIPRRYASPGEPPASWRRRISQSRRQGGTPMAPAIIGAIDALLRMPEEMRILAILTDGGPSEPQDVKSAIGMARHHGIIVITLGILMRGDPTGSFRAFHDTWLDVPNVDHLTRIGMGQLVTIIRRQRDKRRGAARAGRGII